MDESAGERKDYDSEELTIAIVFLSVAVEGLLFGNALYGAVAIAGAEVFVLILLWCCANRSTPELKDRVIYGMKVRIIIPTRLGASVMLPSVLLTMITGFAAVYVSQAVSVGYHKGIPLGTLEAFYFSTVTITTIGDGDIHRFSPAAKIVTMCELACGMTILVGAFPLLVSRITMWTDEAEKICKAACPNLPK